LDERKASDCDISKEVLTVKHIYLILGRELLEVDKAPAGRICALEAEDGWLGGHVLCSKAQDVRNQLFFHSDQQVEPLVRVTIQPNMSGSEQISELKACLKQLAILDGAVRVMVQENGDLALITAGEVHLQKCLKVSHFSFHHFDGIRKIRLKFRI
jgi:ribosome assembly protein 1